MAGATRHYATGSLSVGKIVEILHRREKSTEPFKQAVVLNRHTFRASFSSLFQLSSFIDSGILSDRTSTTCFILDN
jgi:hypothetical protein